MGLKAGGGRGLGYEWLRSSAQRGGGGEGGGGDDSGVSELWSSDGAVAGGRKSWRPWTLSYWDHRGRVGLSRVDVAGSLG